VNAQVTGMHLEVISEDTYFLAESATWDKKDKCYYFVNIFDGELLQFYPQNKKILRYKFAYYISACFLSKTDEIVLATQKGIGIFSRNEKILNLFSHPNKKDESITRYNDCKCDPKGRIFAGTMDLKGRPGYGKLYRVNADGSFETAMENVDYSNGIVWNSRQMFYTDTYSGKVYAFNYDVETAKFYKKKVLCKFPPGQPDGMALDAEGNLWVALWGGFGIACIDVNSGEVRRRIEIPAPNISSICFGGDDYTEVLITTAQKDLTKQQLKSYPQSGSVYIGNIDTVGKDFYRFER